MNTSTYRPPITALLPYFGGKRTIGPKVQRLLRYRRDYAEVFGGSLAALFARDPVPGALEIVNDAYGHVVNLACVMQSPRWIDVAERFARTAMCRPIAEACAEVLEADLEGVACCTDPREVTDEHVEAAYRLLVCSWQGRNGNAGTGRDPGFAVRYTDTGGSPTKRLQGVLKSMPWWHERLFDHTTIERKDAFDFIPKLVDRDSLGIYADPPYVEEGAAYAVNPGPPMFALGWHEKLAELLNAFTEARVVVSYYDHPALAEWYPADRWVKHTIEMPKASGHGAKRGAATSTAVEVLFVNDPEARP